MSNLHTIQLHSKKQFEIIDITVQVRKAVETAGIKSGMALVFCPHTTAAIRLNHHEPLLLQDLMKRLYQLAPLEDNYAHDFFELRTETNAHERTNGHAHVKAFLLGASEAIPIHDGELMLGHRQSVCFVELDGGKSRQVYVSCIGE